MVHVREDMTGWIMSEHGIPDSRLTVIKRVEDHIQPGGRRVPQYLCKCNCGSSKEVISTSHRIKNGTTKIENRELESTENSLPSQFTKPGEYGDPKWKNEELTGVWIRKVELDKEPYKYFNLTKYKLDNAKYSGKLWQSK